MEKRIAEDNHSERYVEAYKSIGLLVVIAMLALLVEATLNGSALAALGLAVCVGIALFAINVWFYRRLKRTSEPYSYNE